MERFLGSDLQGVIGVRDINAVIVSWGYCTTIVSYRWDENLGWPAFLEAIRRMRSCARYVQYLYSSRDLGPQL